MTAEPGSELSQSFECTSKWLNSVYQLSYAVIVNRDSGRTWQVILILSLTSLPTVSDRIN